MESKEQGGYYLPQIPSREEEAEKAEVQGVKGLVLLALIGAIFFSFGAITCYLIYGMRHLNLE